MKKLIKLALIVGAITAAARLIEAKRAEWQGLTEAEVRAKLESRIPDKVPDEKRAMVTERVVEGDAGGWRLVDEPAADA